MSHFMRAKMVVEKVERTGHHDGRAFVFVDKITCRAVGSDKYGPSGASEDNTYARFTPQGELTLTITNPDLAGKIEPGRTFYVNFTPAE